MCAPQLAGLLACWSARGDYQSVGQCQETAEALFHCMRTTVRWTLSPLALHLGLIFIFTPSFCYSRCRKKAIDQQSIITLHGWENRYSENSKPNRACDPCARHRCKVNSISNSCLTVLLGIEVFVLLSLGECIIFTY